MNYENEREVGEAVRTSAVDRGELLVTTKIPGRSHGYDEAIESTNGSLAVLGLDWIDLSLIHWPNPSVDKYVDTWRGDDRPAREADCCARSGSRTSPRRCSRG